MIVSLATTAVTQFLDIGGTRFAYRRFGTPAGTPLVFTRHFMGNLVRSVRNRSRSFSHWGGVARIGDIGGRSALSMSLPRIPGSLALHRV